jgi:hypothetical protein
MNPEIKERWVAALRSGAYAQGVGRLKGPAGTGGGKASYCCLGVLCELAVKDGVIEPPRPRGGKFGSRRDWIYQGEGILDESWSVLPITVAKWADTPLPVTPSPYGCDVFVGVETGDEPIPLSGMNDAGASFEEIADIIERYL